ncbi:MAG: hypothetical protein FJ167_14115 [Gammaproteobacteria bacterium]|nr:hypothetical protein [Gammaproteobacteria bacterium]
MDGPDGISCAMLVGINHQQKEPSMGELIRIGIDTSKRFFQIEGVDAEERVVLQRKLTRPQFLPFF